MAAYSLEPVAVVRTVYPSREACPRQAGSDAEPARIEVAPEFQPALDGVRPGQHLLVLTWLEQGDRACLRCHPRGDVNRPQRGVFTTRSPDRPNPIGLHEVRVLGWENGVLTVSGMEVVDGTAVVDIKSVPGAAADSAVRILKQAGHRCWQRGLSNGLSGNLSLRCENGMYITRSGCGKGHLSTKDIVGLDEQGDSFWGQGRPSSEWRVHHAIYRAQPRARAIVHVHPPCVLALSLGEDIRRAFAALPLYESQVVLDQLAVVPAFDPGSTALATAAGEAAQGAGAIFLTRHGVVCWSEEMDQALALAEEVETLARIRLEAGRRS